MKTALAIYSLGVALYVIAGAQAQSPLPSAGAVAPVTVDNFIRAESDLYISVVALKEGGFGKFEHHRDLSPVDAQTIIRQNRDTLYSAAVFDLDAGPITITLPDAGKRFMSLQTISEDEYSPPAIYQAGPHTFTREGIGTRYVLVGVRTLVDPANPTDMQAARALQDAIKVEQPGGPGKLELPKWDPVSQKKVRNALIVLSTTLTDTSHSFGTKTRSIQSIDLFRRLRPGAVIRRGTPPILLSLRRKTTGRQFTSSRSKTCRSMVSGLSVCIMRRDTSKRTRSTLTRSTTSRERRAPMAP